MTHVTNLAGVILGGALFLFSSVAVPYGYFFRRESLCMAGHILGMIGMLIFAWSWR